MLAAWYNGISGALGRARPARKREEELFLFSPLAAQFKLNISVAIHCEVLNAARVILHPHHDDVIVLVLVNQRADAIPVIVKDVFTLLPLRFYLVRADVGGGNNQVVQLFDGQVMYIDNH
jgi:hypothetical protein